MIKTYKFCCHICLQAMQKKIFYFIPSQKLKTKKVMLLVHSYCNIKQKFISRNIKFASL